MPEAPTIPVVVRMSRSVEEDSGYYPDWRHRQATNYVLVHDRMSEQGYRFEVPPWEDDDEVIRYFAYLKMKNAFSRNDGARFKYSESALEHNLRTGAASRMRSMLIAGVDSTFVAARMGTRVENVETFFRLHFDVEPYLENREFMSNLVFPFVVPRNESPDLKKERLWRTGAFLMGINGLDAIVQKKFSMNSSDLETMNNQYRVLMSSQILEYALNRRSGGAPGFADIEAMQAVMSFFGTEDAKADEDRKRFTDVVVSVLRRTYAARHQNAEEGQFADIPRPTLPAPARRVIKNYTPEVDDAVLFSRQGASNQLRFPN